VHTITNRLKPNSITLASSELAPNMFGASSELASVIEFGFYAFPRLPGARQNSLLIASLNIIAILALLLILGYHVTASSHV